MSEHNVGGLKKHNLIQLYDSTGATGKRAISSKKAPVRVKLEDGENGGHGLPDSGDVSAVAREEDSLPSELIEGSARKRSKSMADEVREAMSAAVEVWRETANTTRAGGSSNIDTGVSNGVNDKEQLLLILRALKLPPLLLVQTLDAIKSDVELFLLMNTDERQELIPVRLGRPKDSLFRVMQAD